MSLSSFFWAYVRRHLGWAGLSIAALLLFGAMSAGMFALLPPLFGELLITDSDVPEDCEAFAAFRAFGALMPEACTEEPRGEDETEVASKIPFLRSIEDFGRRARTAMADEYVDLQNELGIEEGNHVLNPMYFAPALFVLVFLLRSFFNFLSAYSFQRIGYAVTTEIRNDLYDRVLEQSMRFHEQHPSGELYSRVVNDVSRLQNAVSSRLLDLFQQSLTLVVYLAGLFLLNFRLAFICLVAMPALVYPIVRFGKSMRKTSHRSQERMADLSGLLAEGIRGNRVVKAFGMERFEGERFRRATASHLRVNLRAQLLSCISSPVIESLAAIGAATLLVYAAGRIRVGELNAALFLTFLFGLFALYDPIRKLNKVNLIFQEAVAAAQRVRDLMAIPNEIVDDPRQPPLERFEREVRFEHVWFSYGDKQVLEDFDLEIQAGEVVALVGPSGAGKSTIVNLLPRFFDPERGRITIDGRDIRDLPLANLRSLIGMVTQETLLFNDSVRGNIAYGRTDLPLERVREAAAAAYADAFIMELEHGYDMVIGEGGHQLSGGQRQRLAIARALLKNAPMLILDEATSHLDTESELLVQRAIYNLMEGRTALVIAHRLSTVVRADRILVLEQGRIVEEGTHDDLLALGGAYKRLYDLQFP